MVGKLTWFGQSCFLLETAAGTRVVMDPFGKGLGYELPAGVRADLVTISHEHPDHNNVAFVAGKPRVIRGLTPDRKGWARVDEKFRDLTVRSVGVYHDDKRGAARGLDTVFVLEVGGLRIAHLGDLGHRSTRTNWRPSARWTCCWCRSAAGRPSMRGRPRGSSINSARVCS